MRKVTRVDPPSPGGPHGATHVTAPGATITRGLGGWTIGSVPTRPIRFGTDGWREVIADGFTFDRVRVVAAAMARYLHQQGLASRGVGVGYDGRFLSGRFARAVAEVLAGAGIPVLLARRETPTPALAAAVVERGLGGGIVVTASHNPPEFNGLKFKPPYGGSATEAITAPIEREANAILQEQGAEIPRRPLEDAIAAGLVEWMDPIEPYLRRILSLVDVEAIARADLAVAVDPMHGAARGVLAEALRRAGVRRLGAVREEANPGFGGLNPEPIEPNLGPLKAFVRDGGWQAGFAVDGDGDRIGMVDETGGFVNAHQIFSLVLMHLVEHRGLKGEVVKTVSTTSMIDRLAQRYGLPLVETPVGFKYVCARMLEGDVLVGGEESGGIGIRGHIPERDGILSALIMAELMATTRLPVSGLLQELVRRVGPHLYGRLDLHFDESRRQALVQRLAGHAPDRIADVPVKEVKRVDGFKFVLEDGSWLMVRPSGTEPLVRVYAEADRPERLDALLGTGRQWVEQVSAGERSHA